MTHTPHAAMARGRIPRAKDAAETAAMRLMLVAWALSMQQLILYWWFEGNKGIDSLNIPCFENIPLFPTDR